MEPQPLAEPVYGVHPHAGCGRSAGTAAARGAVHGPAPPGEHGRAAGRPAGPRWDGSRTRRTRRERPPGGDASPRGAPALGRAGTKGVSAGSGGDCGAVTAPCPRKAPSVPPPPPRRSPCDCAGLRRPLRPAPRRPLAGAAAT